MFLDTVGRSQGVGLWRGLAGAPRLGGFLEDSQWLRTKVCLQGISGIGGGLGVGVDRGGSSGQWVGAGGGTGDLLECGRVGVE